MNGVRRRKRRAGASGLLISLLCFALAGLLVWGMCAAQKAASPCADPDGCAITDTDGFPLVDWEHWQEVNLDVIGWITIPGTSVNHPIVRAPEHVPEFYLDHDVTGAWNPYGCPYLDADCAEKGLLSLDAVVEGHHLSDGSVFSDIARYVDEAYATEHRVMLLQAPGIKWRFRADAIERIDATETMKETGIADERQLQQWWERTCARAMTCFPDAEAEPERVLTLVTCESAERTDIRVLVHAVLMEESY